jgi:F0F1-type ATP synthase membrane subunit c/vacuolar-type H+-ATPase subunit K
MTIDGSERDHPRVMFWLTRSMSRTRRGSSAQTLDDGCTVQLVHRGDGIDVWSCDNHQIAEAVDVGAPRPATATRWHRACLARATAQPSEWERRFAVVGRRVAATAQELETAQDRLASAQRQVELARKNAELCRERRYEAICDAVTVGISAAVAGLACGLTEDATAQMMKRRRDREARGGDAAKD